MRERVDKKRKGVQRRRVHAGENIGGNGRGKVRRGMVESTGMRPAWSERRCRSNIRGEEDGREEGAKGGGDGSGDVPCGRRVRE